jgi:hypothetical protein
MLLTAEFFMVCGELEAAQGVERVKCLKAMGAAIQEITQLPSAVINGSTDDELQQIVSFAQSPEDETPTPAAPGETA